jgi:hypothetical protein
MDARERMGDIHVFFRTSLGPSSLEREWREHFPECRVVNNWFPYVQYCVIEAECNGMTVTGIWLLADEDELIRIREADEQTMTIIKSMGTSNIESGVLRLFSYEMTPEG